MQKFMKNPNSELLDVPEIDFTENLSGRKFLKDCHVTGTKIQ